MLKLIYLVACLCTLLNGAWMIVSPLSWYTDFPAAIPHTGRFNPHFVRDIGLAYLVAALGFGWCALNLGRSRPVHLGLTLFFGGHALVHLYEILTGYLPHTHWLIDAPLVFLPALLLLALAVPSFRRRLGER
ncbi:MAG: hypothetical protein M3416_08980 [Acidobacteriota bacterium]|nr:hypothetical protein [Acidobacteriota bacterium]